MVAVVGTMGDLMQVLRRVNRRAKTSYEWHQLLLRWTAANLDGEAKPFLPEPCNWKTYGDMNVYFWNKHQSVTVSPPPPAITNGR